jgi:ankyrin repeat protein
MQDFFDAIKAGDAAKAGALLDVDPSLLDERDGNVSPILLALYHGKADLARSFVERGATLSFPEACAVGDLARVRALLDSDPSLLDARSDDGYPALGLAIFFRQPEVARLLIERGADVNAAADNAMRVAPVHAAAGVCDHDTLRLLLERGADANAKQQQDYAPLHTAGARGDRTMAELLLAHGADRTARGSDGLGAAEVADKYGKAEFAAWLRSLT